MEFLKGNDLPQYFNNHQIHIAARTKKILAKKLGLLLKILVVLLFI